MTSRDFRTGAPGPSRRTGDLAGRKREGGR